MSGGCPSIWSPSVWRALSRHHHRCWFSNNPSDEVLLDLKNKLRISSDKHHSKGVIVFGHSDCAGDPVDDETQKVHIRKATEVVKRLLASDALDIPVCSIFVKKYDNNPTEWVVEEI